MDAQEVAMVLFWRIPNYFKIIILDHIIILKLWWHIAHCHSPTHDIVEYQGYEHVQMLLSLDYIISPLVGVL